MMNPPEKCIIVIIFSSHWGCLKTVGQILWKSLYKMNKISKFKVSVNWSKELVESEISENHGWQSSSCSQNIQPALFSYLAPVNIHPGVLTNIGNLSLLGNGYFAGDCGSKIIVVKWIWDIYLSFYAMISIVFHINFPRSYSNIIDKPKCNSK